MSKQLKCGNFIKKLQSLLENGEMSEIICWDESKTHIDILDVIRLENQIIPVYFRHKKFQSFVRQLNLYGFKKIKIQGKQRFTHNLLLKGQTLNAITSAKSIKNHREQKEGSDNSEDIVQIGKKLRQTLQSSLENENEKQMEERIPQNFLNKQQAGAFLLDQSMFNPYFYYPQMINYLNLCAVYSNPPLYNMQTYYQMQQTVQTPQQSLPAPGNFN